MSTPSKTLVNHLEEAVLNNSNDFPHGEGDAHLERYRSIARYLADNYHQYVEVAAASKESVFLTSHGERHIKKVIARASEIVSELKIDLSGYEIYLLLSAIQFHDVGNIFGRRGHEQKINQIISDLNQILPTPAERNFITRIAQAHSGYVPGEPDNKDTLGTLEVDTTGIGGAEVRLPLLAAILRLADELAEDSSRTSETILDHNLAPDSEAYHKYANSLYGVSIDADSKLIHLKFWLYKPDVLHKWKIDQKSIYIIDYIYERTIKTYLECKYCMRYCASFVGLNSTRTFPLEAVKVKVDIYEKTPEGEDIIETIFYTLRESGYPIFPSNTKNTLRQLAPQSDILSGQELKKKIKNAAK